MLRRKPVSFFCLMEPQLCPPAGSPLNIQFDPDLRIVQPDNNIPLFNTVPFLEMDLLDPQGQERLKPHPLQRVYRTTGDTGNRPLHHPPSHFNNPDLHRSFMEIEIDDKSNAE